MSTVIDTEISETEKLERNFSYTIDFCKKTVKSWHFWNITKADVKWEIKKIKLTQSSPFFRNNNLIDSFVFEYLETALAEYKSV